MKDKKLSTKPLKISEMDQILNCRISFVRLQKNKGLIISMANYIIPERARGAPNPRRLRGA